MRTCRYCKAKFDPKPPGARVCSPDCASGLVVKMKQKRVRAEIRQQKEKLKSRQDWMREAQAAFNHWIRLRDAKEPCISCGRHHLGQYHAGHYRSRGAMSALAFHPDNVHKQCAPCNNQKSGNVVEYRLRLLTKIGAERLAFLEGPHEPKKYTVDELRQIKAEYTIKARELVKAGED